MADVEPATVTEIDTTGSDKRYACFRYTGTGVKKDHGWCRSFADALELISPHHVERGWKIREERVVGPRGTVKVEFVYDLAVVDNRVVPVRKYPYVHPSHKKPPNGGSNLTAPEAKI